MGAARGIALSIGAGTNQVPLIRALADRGFSVAAIDRDINAPGFEHCDFWAPIPARDAPGPLLRWLRTLPKPPIAVGCFSFGPALATREAIAAELGLPCLPPAADWMVRGKAEQLQALTGLGLVHRQWWTEARRFDADRTYLVKPSVGGGSSGIRVATGDQIAALLAEPTVVEERVEGREYRLQVWVRDGQIAWLAQLERHNWGDTLCLARLTPVEPAEAWANEVAQTLIEAGGLREAVLKVDLIRHDGLCDVIEVDPGIAGDHFEDGVSQAFYGVDTVCAYIDLLTGALPSFAGAGGAFEAFDYVYHPRPGQRRRDAALIRRALDDALPSGQLIVHGADGTMAAGPPTGNADALGGILHHADQMPPEDLSLTIARRLDDLENPT